MDDFGCKDILIKSCPLDVHAELRRRADRNYRSVSGEILAILTAVCRGGDSLPGLGIGEVLPGPETAGKENGGIAADELDERGETSVGGDADEQNEPDATSVGGDDENGGAI